MTSDSRVKRALTWAMSKWRRQFRPLMKRRMKTFSWRKDLKLNAPRCSSGTHASVTFTEETIETSDSRAKRALTRAMSRWRETVWPSMKRSIETFSWRMDLKLNASRCFSWTHATVGLTKETVVTSDSRVKRVFCVKSTSPAKENLNKNGYVNYTTFTRTSSRPMRTTIMTPSTPTRMTRTITTRAICTSEHSSALFSRVSCLDVGS